MEGKLEEAKVMLKKYNQEHLLNGYENLDEGLKQLGGIIERRTSD